MLILLSASHQNMCHFILGAKSKSTGLSSHVSPSLSDHRGDMPTIRTIESSVEPDLVKSVKKRKNKRLRNQFKKIVPDKPKKKRAAGLVGFKDLKERLNTLDAEFANTLNDLSVTGDSDYRKLSTFSIIQTLTP